MPEEEPVIEQAILDRYLPEQQKGTPWEDLPPGVKVSLSHRLGLLYQR